MLKERKEEWRRGKKRSGVRWMEMREEETGMEADHE